MSHYTNVIETVPAGLIGHAQVVHDSPDKLERLQAAMHGMPLDREKYARLLVNGHVMMTDADFEKRTNIGFITEARGDVLVAGLGLGLILSPRVRERCASITVIEKSADVIALVGPSFPGCRIIQADIREWTPERGTKYDTIYFDIWPEICEDDIAEAKTLQSRFRKFLRKGGWMRSWCTFALAACGRRR